MSQLKYIAHKINLLVERMDFSDCVVIVTCVVAVGIICMRGNRVNN